MNAPIRKPAASGRVRSVVSPGGIEAWLVEDHTVPLIAMEFSFSAGAAHEPADRCGTATMLASTLDEGAGPYDSAAFHEALADRAIELSFSNGLDWFHGSLKTLTRHRDEAVRLARLALNEARLDAEPMERVRAHILADLRYEANEPDVLASHRFFERAFPGHPYSRPTSGTIAALPLITRDDLVAFRSRILARDNLIVAVVGAIDEAQLAAALDDMFGDLPAKADVVPVPDAVLTGLGAVDIIDLDVPQTTFMFGAPGLKRADPDFNAAAVVNHILGEGTFTSRLWQEVREKRGLAYSVRASLHPLRKSGIYYGSTSTKNERAGEALAIIKSEIARMAADGPTAEELDNAKKYMIGSYALRFDTSTKIANQLNSIAFDGLGIDYIERRNALIAAVTLDDAARVAKRLYGEGNLLVAAAGRPVGLA